MTEFTPASALLGGFLIGAAAVLMMALLGRIAGISGIVGGLVSPKMGDWAWRAAFVAGLLAAPFLYHAITAAPQNVDVPVPLPLLILGGLLVGFGTQLGSGCTSGHGVCGISRVSLRSIVATLVFMLSAIATVFISRHILGLW